jgi:hypothetical protein
MYRELPEEVETRIAPVRLARVDGARGVSLAFFFWSKVEVETERERSKVERRK